MSARSIAPLLAMFMLALAPLSAAAGATPSPSGAAATLTGAGCLSVAALCALAGTPAARALEETLAQKYAPVVYLKT